MERQFPILIGYRGTMGPCPSSIPWSSIAPYEAQAQVNHGQSLEKLASRGGLAPLEALFVMTGQKLSGWPAFTDEMQKEACTFLDKIVRDREDLHAERDALLLQLEDLKLKIVTLHADVERLKLALEHNGLYRPCVTNG